MDTINRAATSERENFHLAQTAPQHLSTKRYFDKLPDEIIWKISDNILGKSYFTLGMVDRRMRRILLNQRLFQNFPLLSSIVVVANTITKYPRVFLDFERSSIPSAPALSQLSSYEQRWKNLDILSQKLVELQRLIVRERSQGPPLLSQLRRYLEPYLDQPLCREIDKTLMQTFSKICKCLCAPSPDFQREICQNLSQICKEILRFQISSEPSYQEVGIILGRIHHKFLHIFQKEENIAQVTQLLAQDMFFCRRGMIRIKSNLSSTTCGCRDCGTIRNNPLYLIKDEDLALSMQERRFYIEAALAWIQDHPLDVRNIWWLDTVGSFMLNSTDFDNVVLIDIVVHRIFEFIKANLQGDQSKPELLALLYNLLRFLMKKHPPINDLVENFIRALNAREYDCLRANFGDVMTAQLATLVTRDYPRGQMYDFRNTIASKLEALIRKCDAKLSEQDVTTIACFFAERRGQEDPSESLEAIPNLWVIRMTSELATLEESDFPGEICQRLGDLYDAFSADKKEDIYRTMMLESGESSESHKKTPEDILTYIGLGLCDVDSVAQFIEKNRVGCLDEWVRYMETKMSFDPHSLLAIEEFFNLFSNHSISNETLRKLFTSLSSSGRARFFRLLSLQKHNTFALRLIHVHTDLGKFLSPEETNILLKKFFRLSEVHRYCFFLEYKLYIRSHIYRHADRQHPIPLDELALYMSSIEKFVRYFKDREEVVQTGLESILLYSMPSWSRQQVVDYRTTGR